MALPRPSLTLVLDIDERLDSEALRLEIGRCYAHVCQTLVRTHPADTAAAASTHAVGSESGKAPSTAETDIATDTAKGPGAQTNASAPCNIARFLVKMGTRRYLDPKDEGANELWNDVIERWIGNELRKVGNNMRIFNRRQREEGRDPLMFDWYELDLQNGQLSVLLRCDSTSAVDPSANATITALREAYGNNALGENVERVRMPAPEEYERQRKIGLAAKARREAEKAARAQAEAERARAEAEAAEREAEEAFLESPELMAHAATPDERRSDTVSDTSEAANARDAQPKATRATPRVARTAARQSRIATPRKRPTSPWTIACGRSNTPTEARACSIRQTQPSSNPSSPSIRPNPSRPPASTGVPKRRSSHDRRHRILRRAHRKGARAGPQRQDRGARTPRRAFAG